MAEEIKTKTSAGMETPGETVSRAEGMLENIGSTSNTTTGSSNDAFIEEVQNRLLNQADVISSTDTQLEQTFSEAISGIEESQEKSAQRIESQFDRERRFAEGQAEDQFTQFSESRSGFGTQMVAFRRLVETTDKELKDLEQRKQELILQGESQAASQIANLQVQQLQMRQQAQQNVFSNLLGLGQFAQQQQQQNLAERKFGLQQDQFDLQTRQFSLQQENQAFNRLASLQEMGALTGLPDEQRVELEQQAGLPAGSMANVKPNMDVRAVGDTLIGVNPRTGDVQVLYNGSSEGSEGVTYGGETVTFMTSSVLSGLQKLDNMTSTERQKVIAEMNKLGFGNEEPPQWYKNKIRKPNPGLTDETIKGHWNEWNKNLTSGPEFLDKNFLRQLFSVAPQGEQLSDLADESGQSEEQYLINLENSIKELRADGMTDQEILESMQK